MLDAVIAAVVAVPTILSALFVIEVAVGIRSTKPRKRSDGVIARAATIIVPAHNEAGSIADTVSALSREIQGLATLLVVADNCSDRTAEIARGLGALTIVRDNPAARGKGFALAFARDYLANDPPAVVLVVDADCRIDRESLAALIDSAASRPRPAQAINLLRGDLSAPPFVQLSNLAFLVRNLVRQRGLQRLAGRVHLTGTGMALPWQLFKNAELGGDSIVEDLELGLWLSKRGHAPILVEDATVWSPAASAQGTLQQRERWEGGFLRHGLRAGLRELGVGLTRFDVRLIIGAIDLCIPPLVLLVLLDLGAIIVAALAYAWGANVYPLIAIFIATIAVGLAVMVAWYFEGRSYASLGTIARLPVYMLKKLPMYGRIFVHGAPRNWLRADRDN